MSVSNIKFSGILDKTKNLFETGKFNELIGYLDKNTHRSNYSFKQQLSLSFYHCRSFYFIGDYQSALQLGKNAIKIAQQVNPCLEVIDIHLFVAKVLNLLDKNQESIVLCHQKIGLILRLP